MAIQDRLGETMYLCGGLREARKQPFDLFEAECGGHGFPLASVHLTCYSQDVRIHRIPDNVTFSPSKTTIENHCRKFPNAIRLSVNGAGVLENMVDGLGIRDP